MREQPVSDPNYQGYMLPAVINPPDSLCFTVKVPNDQGHIAAFFGALYDLTQWMTWARDPAKRGKDAAAVWKDIWQDLVAQSCELPPSALKGAEIEDFMPLRVDCDCNVFVTCCDGTEKQILTSDQVKALINGPTTIPVPQPPAGGGTQVYGICVSSMRGQIIPTPVSTGDTITATYLNGATADSLLGYWRCGDGFVFFAGACTGSQITDSGSLVPSAPLGVPVVLLGGNYYSLETPLTVPGGITNQQGILFANWPPGGVDMGNVCWDIEVVNNTAVNWCHKANFIVATDGWTTDPSFVQGNWVAGVGWESQDVGSAPNFNRGVYIKRVFTATVTRIIATVNWTPGAGFPGSDIAWEFTDNSGNFNQITRSAMPGTGSGVIIDTGPISRSMTSLHANITADIESTLGGLQGTAIIQSIEIHGTGTNPFGASNC